ncbi:ppiC [Symbiodinium necroappetens]|uniref:Peptidyl-prolyl cis-trans isomerase C n=1 Tax=Symbiodinium necroappetens TaxID=1628268 RepID=A0A813AF65_9DINO|nr:ppiC [Symbiodinium necroappetens]
MTTPIGFLDSWTCRFGVEGLSAQLDASPVLDSFPPEGIMFCDEDGRQIRLDRAGIQRIMSCTWACHLLLEARHPRAQTPSCCLIAARGEPFMRVKPPAISTPQQVTSASEWILKMGTRIREPAIIWGQLKFTYGHLFIVFCGLFVLSSTMYMLYSADSQSRKIKSASARHILMQSEADILQAKARIEGGESFSRVAKALSQCKSAVDGGDLGVFQPGELHPSFDRVVFNRSNPIGQVLGPVKTKFGWHLFRVEYRTGFNESNDSFDEPLGDGPLVQSEGRCGLSDRVMRWATTNCAVVVDMACGLYHVRTVRLASAMEGKAFELGRCVHINPSGPSVLDFALTEGIRYGSTLTGRLDLSRSFVGCLNSFRSGHPKRYGTRPEIRKKRGLFLTPARIANMFIARHEKMMMFSIEVYVPSSVDAGCDEMLRCGDFLYESVFVRRIGVVDGVDIGLGLFTRRAVAKGTFLGEYVGVMTRRTCEEDGVYGFSLPVVDPDLVVDAKKFGNLCRLINHSDDDWNAELMSVHHEGLLHVMCRATRDLMPEEQVFIHYGKRYWMPEARRCVRLGCAPDT